MFRDRKKIKPFSLKATDGFFDDEPVSGGSPKESFIDNIILVPQSESAEAVTVKDLDIRCTGRVYRDGEQEGEKMLIRDCIHKTVNDLLVQIEKLQNGTAKAEVEAQKQERDDLAKVIRYIEKHPSTLKNLFPDYLFAKDIFSTEVYKNQDEARQNHWHTTKRMAHSGNFMDGGLNIRFNEKKFFRNALAEVYDEFINLTDSHNIDIPTQIQHGIIYEIYCYADWDNGKGDNYSQMNISDAIESISIERGRLFDITF